MHVYSLKFRVVSEKAVTDQEGMFDTHKSMKACECLVKGTLIKPDAFYTEKLCCKWKIRCTAISAYLLSVFDYVVDTFAILLSYNV